MKIGYSYWGYLGDTKYDLQGNVASTPDGNAFYSWSIINKLQEDGHKVYSIMPDRDYPAFYYGKYLFDSWCTEQRKSAYSNICNIWYNYDFITTDSYYKIRSMVRDNQLYGYIASALDNMDVVLHEWRMPIPGRNINVSDDDYINYQPDLDIQNCILRYFGEHPNKKLIIFDLDYKLDVNELGKLPGGGRNIYVFELGYKLSNKYSNAFRVEIPFDFRYINWFPLEKKYNKPHINNLVYVGNRYERDWCIDKYIPTEMDGVKVYGNWLESGRDSAEKWPNIEFGPRVQTANMPEIYQNSLATILLAKKDYLEYSFMTARIIEAVFYGCVPLFIEEYGDACIKKYAGIYSQYLTVSSKSDIINIVYYLRYNDSYRRHILSYLREHLKFMDVKHFVDKLYYVMRGELKWLNTI